MANSVMQKDKVCYICGTTRHLEKHHCMNGANRKKADKDGLWVWLCRDCHTGHRGVHQNAGLMRELKAQAQTIYEYDHSHEEWMKEYGRNYRNE